MLSVVSLAQAKFVFGPDRVTRDRLNACPRGRFVPGAIEAGLIGAPAIASAFGCVVPTRRGLVLRWVQASPGQPGGTGRPRFADAATRVDRAGFFLVGARIARFGFGSAAHGSATHAPGSGGRVPRPRTARPSAAGPCTARSRVTSITAGATARCRASGTRRGAAISARGVSARSIAVAGRAGPRRNWRPGGCGTGAIAR